MRVPFLIAVATILPATAQGPRLESRGLGGGDPELAVHLELQSTSDGRPRGFTFAGLPAGAATLMIVSWRPSKLVLPFVRGTVRADPTAPGSGVFGVAGRMPMRDVSTFLTQHPLVLQGVVVDAKGLRVTDALEVRYTGIDENVVSRAGAFPRFSRPPRPYVIAHKGNTGNAPENTLAAIDRAFAIGADHVEVDVRATADGVPVLMHDWTVDRTTDGKGFVGDFEFEELRKLSVGAGQRVPSLSEALAHVQGRGRLLLDVKENWLGPAIRRAITKAGIAPDAVWLYVFASRVALLEFHRELPETPVLWGHVPAEWNDRFFADLRALGVVGFDVDHATVRPDFVAAAHRAGMCVFTYTVNEEADMRRAIAAGVDGIETDEPARLRQLLPVPRPPPVPNPTWLFVGLGGIVGCGLWWLLRRRR